MISNRPYFIRAMFQWIVDNGWTPHLQVDAEYPNAQVPQEYVQDGVIILNVHPSAVVDLNLENDFISFRARFKGLEQSIYFPPSAVLAIFARENGQGMPFPPEPYLDEEFDDEEDESPVKGLSSVDGGKSNTRETSPEKPKRPTKKPTLSVVK